MLCRRIPLLPARGCSFGSIPATRMANELLLSMKETISRNVGPCMIQGPAWNIPGARLGEATTPCMPATPRRMLGLACSRSNPHPAFKTSHNRAGHRYWACNNGKSRAKIRAQIIQTRQYSAIKKKNGRPFASGSRKRPEPAAIIRTRGRGGARKSTCRRRRPIRCRPERQNPDYCWFRQRAKAPISYGAPIVNSGGPRVVDQGRRDGPAS